MMAANGARSGSCALGVLLVLLAPFATSTRAYAGAWTLGPRHFYSKLSYGYSFASSRFDSNGNRLPLYDETFLGLFGPPIVTRGNVQEHAIRLYGEVGLLDRLDAFGSLAWKADSTHFGCGPSSAPQRCQSDSITADNTSVDMANHGFGDLEIGGKLGILRAPVVSFALLGSFPLYSNDLDVLRVNDQNLFNDRTPLGSGSIDVEGRMLVGQSFGRWWANVEAGYRARSDGFGDRFVYLAQAGAPVAWRLSAGLALVGFVGLGSGSRDDAHEPPLTDETLGVGKVIYPSNEHAHKVLPSFAWSLPHGLAIELVGQWTYAGVRTNASLGAELGLSWRR